MSSKTIKVLKTIKNNWKKSLFATIVTAYGVNYVKEYFEIQNIMKVYCEKSLKYGHQILPVNVQSRNITIILNPNANKRKCNKEFEKYCAPLLHLAGIAVDVIKTESEGHAKDLINELKNTEAIVVAGGDGTLSEVLTGLMRRTNEHTQIPIGVLPLGKTNSLAENLFPAKQKVESLAKATMAIIENYFKPIDIMKIEIVDGGNNNNNNNSNSKPIYGVIGLKWGAYRDAEIKKDIYWYYGRFRKYATYLFNGYKNNLTWKCEGEIIYSPPCSGCFNCLGIKKNEKKWYSKYIKSNNTNELQFNPNCEQIDSKCISSVDFNVSTPNIKNFEDNIPKLLLELGPNKVSYLDFIKNGFKYENGESKKVCESIECRTLEIIPKTKENSQEEKWFSIDNENFELKPIRITLLPKIVNVFINQ